MVAGERIRCAVDEVSRRARFGFTLVELLVAMTLLAIGILAVATLSLRSTRSAAVSEAISTAESIAGSRVELLRSAPASAVEANDSPVLAACRQKATVGGLDYVVACSFEVVCEDAPCPPGRETLLYTVQAQSSAQSNPVTLSSKVLR